MINSVVILLNISHSVTPSMVPYTVLEKALWTYDSDESSGGIYTNLFGRVVLVDTEYSAPLLFPY